jgi:hypothetical protein
MENANSTLRRFVVELQELVALELEVIWDGVAGTQTGPWGHESELLQLRVLRLGLLQDGDVGVGIFPEGKKVLVGSERPYSCRIVCE